jgi:hypothetical protein
MNRLMPDFTKENQYEFECGGCHGHFLGHKGRVLCDVCKLAAEAGPVNGMSLEHHVAMVLHGKFGSQVGLNEAESWVPIARAAIEAQERQDQSELGEAAETALMWLDNWAQHVGRCPDGQVCTCGLDAVRNELRNGIGDDCYDTV